MITLTFLFLLLLENMFLPALIGPKPILITPLFIIAILIYRKDWKIFILQAVPLVLLEEFFTGIGFGRILLPITFTWLLYVWTDKFINLNDDLKEDISPKGLLVASAVLALFVFFYSGLFIFSDNGYNVLKSFVQFELFFKNSLLSILGWSLAISILFKYVFKKK